MLIYDNGKYKTEYDLVEISIPKSLKVIQVDIGKDKTESHTFSHSKNRNFEDASSVEITKNNAIIDVSSLRINSDIYCKFIKEIGVAQYTCFYHFTFK